MKKCGGGGYLFSLASYHRYKNTIDIDCPNVSHTIILVFNAALLSLTGILVDILNVNSVSSLFHLLRNDWYLNSAGLAVD